MKEKVRYVILLIVTMKGYRNLGFGNAAIYDYLEYVNDSSRKVEVILHSLIESEKFYLKRGFTKIKRNLFLERLEGNNDQDNIYLKLCID